MKGIILVVLIMLCFAGSIQAQTFAGMTGNLTPQGVGALFIGYSFENIFVETMWYGKDIFSLDVALMKPKWNFVLSYGGRGANDRSKDFLCALWVPKWSLGGNIMVFAKGGWCIDIGPGSGKFQNKNYTVIGVGVFYSF